MRPAMTIHTRIPRTLGTTLNLIAAVLCVFVFAMGALAQSDRGTLTGSVTDSSGALVPKAQITVTNLNTGSKFTSESTSTGLYAVTSLPAGSYKVEVMEPGFKNYIQTGITISVAQTAQVNVKLTVGGASETITVDQDASLLKTENAELSTTISRKDLNDLPIPFVQVAAMRDPMAFVKLTPGAYVQPGSNTYVRVNGLPAGSFKISVDGMDATNPNINDREDGNHPSVDNVEQFTVQTSNFAAEYGQVGGGLFNFTARSGTNVYHGSAYDYFTNEDLNAGRPFSQPVAGGPIGSYRQKVRQNDYGFTIGGPVRIPHLYNGRDKTFFFFSSENFRLDSTASTTMTVPTDSMRKGDFHEILTGLQLGTDPLGRPVYQNAIYNPATARCSTPGLTIAACASGGGQVVSDPYPGNVITSGFDQVALKIQALVPTQQAGYQCAAGGLCFNNLTVPVSNPTRQMIPAFKIDQVITQQLKASFSYSDMRISSFSSNEGLPLPISSIRPNFGHADVYRFNVDYTITPNLLVHAGAGYTRQFQNDGSPAVVDNYNAQANLGLPNTVALGFPRINGLNYGNFGGIINGNGNGLGPTQRNQYWSDKANGIASAVWTHGSHVVKGGVDFKQDMWYLMASAGSNNVAGNFGFSNCETTALYNNCTGYQVGSASGNTGFPYASFLLGLVDNGSIGDANVNQYHRPTFALYLQDTWRATKRLSIDYGLRWDFTETSREHAYRTSGFSPNVANPGALRNGTPIPGALAFEGFGHAGDCECYFMPHYPYAIGPRLGVAFQADPKTVFRAGFGITYGQAASFNYAGSNFSVVSVGINTVTYVKPTVAGLGASVTPATTLTAGPIYAPSQITDASRNPAFNCCTAINQAPSPMFAPNGGKPPRIFNFTVSMEREINKNLAVEIAYVGNRAAWLTSGANGAAGIVQPNALSTARLASFGFDATNLTDVGYLNATIAQLAGTPALARLPAGFLYTGFPTSQKLYQALRPFPQYGTVYTEYSPSANSWYDALQIKVTQRAWHGLQVLNSFTWSKEQDLGADTGRGNGAVINDVTNRGSNKFLTSSYQPFVNVTSFTYELPLASFGRDSLWKREVLKGWQIGGIFRYASGALLAVPTDGTPTSTPAGQPAYVLSSANISASTGRSTYAHRVPGAPLFNQNPNCHCFNPLNLNPTTAGVLNVNAWSNQSTGQFGNTAVYQNDYRWQRQPDEELNLGKRFTFPIWKEKEAALQVRVEFFNVFNRTYLPAPSVNGYFQRVGASGGGGTGAFGNINVVNNLGTSAYRTGQLVARFEF